MRVLGIPWLVWQGGAERSLRLFGRMVWSANRKVGASYNLFDGEELLPSSLRSIRSQVDFIHVVFQDVSNFGERRSKTVRPLLDELKANGLIDSYSSYEPDLGAKAAENEHRKRLIGLAACRKAGCAYYLDMDVDEYYRADEFRTAKRFVFEHGIDISAATIVAYIKSPRYRADTDCYVPFLIRIPRVACGFPSRDPYPVCVDPTRIFRTSGRFYLFEHKTIVMHHMSWVRKDLDKKFRNSSLNDRPDSGELMARLRELAQWSFGAHQLPRGTDVFNGRLIREVADEFGVGREVFDESHREETRKWDSSGR